MASSDEKFYLRKQKHVKNQNYYEETISLYSNKKFLEHFRIYSDIARNLTQLFEAIITCFVQLQVKKKIGIPRIPFCNI